jgi:hypothetical protein
MHRNKLNHFRSYSGLCRTLLLLSAGLLIFHHSKAGDLKETETTQRIEFLKKCLQNDQDGTRLWWYGWLAGYGSATIGQGAVYFTSSETSTKQDMALGAATCFVGFAGQFVSPFQPGKFMRQFEQMPEVTEEERSNKLKQMEKFLAQKSEMEINARKWKAHVIPTAVNLASGLVTWIGFHRTVWDGVVNFGLNCVITESQIWSQPVRARKGLKRYCESFGKTGLSGMSQRDIRCNFMVTASGAGLKVIF